jgi:uncharacterized protein YbjT (DUF2867 family)
MEVVVAGGHGQVGVRLLALLAHGGHQARGLIRNPDHAADLSAIGAEPVVCDMERLDDLTECCAGADAVVFAAGAGPGSGIARKDTVDRAAAVLFADAAVRAGVRRHVVVSSMGADPDHRGDDVFDVYLRAKGEADAHVSGLDALDWTILRPGTLTDAPGTGLVRLEAHTGHGTVSRDDVAAVLAELVDSSATTGLTLELIGGSTPVSVAVKSVAGN